jgi:L-ribulose-5-phosphate 3-epimerase
MVAATVPVCYHQCTSIPDHPEEATAVKKSIMRATLPQPSQQPLRTLLDPIKKAGFDGIQLGFLEPVGELTLRTADTEVEKLHRTLSDAGLESHSLVFTPRFLQEDPSGRKKAVDDGLRVIEMAGILGAKTILVHPGQLTAELPYDDCWRYAIECLQALKTKAEATHVRLGLENVWNKFLMSPLEFRHLLEEVNSPQVGIWFDIGNVVAFGFPEQWLRILGPKHLVGLHIKDFRRGPGDHFGTYDGFVPLFHGSVNWPKVMQQLAALGFDDYLVTEVSLGRQPIAKSLEEVSRQLDVLIAQAKDKP